MLTPSKALYKSAVHHGFTSPDPFCAPGPRKIQGEPEAYRRCAKLGKCHNKRSLRRISGLLYPCETRAGAAAESRCHRFPAPALLVQLPGAPETMDGIRQGQVRGRSGCG